MKIGSDKIKYPGRFFAAILLAVSAVLLYLAIEKTEKTPAELAALSMEQGNYSEAARIYLELGDNAMYEQCLQLHDEQCYLSAEHMMQMGQYQKAIEGFSALGSYKQSLNYLDACRYLWSGELAESGEYLPAWELCLAISDYPGRNELLEKCSEGIMAEASELALQGDYTGAGELLAALGDYSDARLLAGQAERMAQWLSEAESQRLLTEDKKYPNSYYEHVYKTESAYIVVPEECSSECRFLLYFPGGKDDEINIDFLLYYLMNPVPDTVAVFLRRNGVYDMEGKSLEATELMEHAAAECGVFIRELVSCGSSLGAYPAMQSAVYIPRQSGIPVPCVLSLDAGDDWQSPYTLSRSQCIDTASKGTEFYLFESPWVGTDRAAIRLMVETGNNVILVGCTYDEHVRITLDAMGMGVLHWALGDRTIPCKLGIYNFSKLTA